MDTFDAIQQRRAIKQFDPEHDMPQADLDKLIQAVLHSPTSFNMQNWRFVVVRDKALRAQLREAAAGQAQVTDASVLFVLTADLKAFGNNPGRYFAHLPAELTERMAGVLTGFYNGNEQLQRDEAIRSCGIAAQTLMLAAKAMGYDSCPMIGFDSQRFGELINLPQDHVIGLIVPVGIGTRPAADKTHQLSIDEVVVHDRFPDPS